MKDADGVILNEGESLSALNDLPAGTPIAVCTKGQWWPYKSIGNGLNNPVGSYSFSKAEHALQAARVSLH
ncbi:TPA: hypothetical protein NI618_001711 [Pseudomonas aeruginosa]|nr:hypothetical protein [Pseudomonas aeruginosa]MCV4061333.1 hypothetical protein [Pseudomonas aeruginosa]MCV4077182.1 hypothetical protein [Pseudomonas aeruginosa]MCV4148747.1 hypothetical protein [Pseudomonas aeruginosa]MCV4180450.1 hypothetical protein [Pseudomonas aeruginosa]MCV4219913.1 hypothetical protein [Pseudomonas aeruginosa]